MVSATPELSCRDQLVYPFAERKTDRCALGDSPRTIGSIDDALTGAGDGRAMRYVLIPLKDDMTDLDVAMWRALRRRAWLAHHP